MSEYTKNVNIHPLKSIYSNISNLLIFLLQFNFVGKLLGPKGNSLKRLQEDTMCKMAVLGRGSMKDRQKVWLETLKSNDSAAGMVNYVNEWILWTQIYLFVHLCINKVELMPQDITCQS